MLKETPKLQPRGDGPFQVLKKINHNAYKLDLPREYGNICATFNVLDLSLFDVGNESDLRMNPFKDWGNDGGTIILSNDPLQGIGGPMTRSKTKRLKQALQGLILKIKEKEDQCELRATPYWVTLLQIDEDALKKTWIITLGSIIYKTKSMHELSWLILVDY